MKKKKIYDDKDAENVDDDLTMNNVVGGQKIIQNPSGTVDQVNLFKNILIPSRNDILSSENIHQLSQRFTVAEIIDQNILNTEEDDDDDDDDDNNQENRKCPTPPYFN